METGRSIQLFFVNGKPDGILIANFFNWTGHILRTPRLELSTALARNEAQFSGVYILIGQNDGVTTTYIGESDNIRERIKSHDAKKDWWDTAVLITSESDALNKAHIRFLESKLIQTAKIAGNCVLDNATTPNLIPLNAAETSDMNIFLENILFALPTIGIDVFQNNKRTENETITPTARPSDVFELYMPKYNIRAKAQQIDGEFIVLKGSEAHASWRGSSDHNYRKLHADLVRRGIIIPKGEFATFTENYAFSSPSAAAAMVTGRAANGRTEWKTADTKVSFGDWSDAKLKSELSETLND